MWMKIFLFPRASRAREGRLILTKGTASLKGQTIKCLVAESNGADNVYKFAHERIMIERGER